MTPRDVQRLARAFEHSAAGIALQSPQGRWLDVNPAFCRMVGYEREALLDKSFTDITHPDDRSRSLGQLERLNRGEIASFRFDKRYIHADGRDVWVRLDVSMVRDEQDRPELIITQVHDITASRQIRDQLTESEARLRSIIRSMAEGVIVVEADGSFSLGNERAAEILGLEGRPLEGMVLADFMHLCTRPDGRAMPVTEYPVWRTLVSGEPQREIVMGVERPDGRAVWVEISTEPVGTEDDGEVRSVVATFSDVTERMHTERALQESEERLSLAVDGAKLGMWDWHLDTGEFSFNRIALVMLGYEAGDVANDVESVRALAHPSDEARLVKQMEAHLAGHLQAFEVDVRMGRKSGGFVWTNMRGRVTRRDARGRPLRVTGMLIDISQRKELERQLHELATTDSLTGLLNRRAGTDKLTAEIERARRAGSALSLVLLDIDHFKQVNDHFGHDVGDRVLREVADLLRARIRKTDAAARWGGEEFALILPETGLDGADRFAGELLARMRGIRTPDGAPLSASFGVVALDADESASALVKRADRLMYRAKHAGRGRVEREPQTRARAS